MIGMARNAGKIKGFTSSLLRFHHGLAQPAPLETAMSQAAASRPFLLPEFDRATDSIQKSEIGFDFSALYIGSGSGSMELMAVPKKKVSPHKRGIRNGPKALKPVPVIVRCKVCGRVKLPHFFCCSGIRETPEGQNGSTS